MYRPNLHFSAKKGWINDPNGLIFFQEKYHLYYQYNPYGCDWDSMHWGHAVSKDLLHWEEYEIVLFPDQSYDQHKEGGCFSGSVIVKDDRIFLFYTGSIKNDDLLVQSQCAAVSEDGFLFKKLECNPLLKKHPLDGGNDFRDPKVIYAQGRFRMVCGGTDISADDPLSHGRIYLFNSDDLLHWEYAGILYQAGDGEGSMYECPDLFMIDDKWILTASPMYRSDYKQNIFMMGSVDFEQCTFVKESEGMLDTGTHYYAVQTYENISIAWLGGWNWMPWIHKKSPTNKEGFRGVLSIPRKNWIDKEGYLCSGFYPDFKECVIEKYTEKEVSLSYADNSILKYLKELNQTIHLFFAINYENWKSKELQLFLKGEKSSGIEYSFLLDHKKCIINYNMADQYSRYGIREFDIELKDGYLDFEMLIDKSVCTMFIAKGRYANTTTFFPENGELSLIIKSLDKEDVLENVKIEFLK